jgi:pyruvate, orthophosphate dikinase
VVHGGRGQWCTVLDGTHLPAKEEIGGKAHSIAWMRGLGLPVPPAFVLPTWICARYREAGGTLPEQAWKAVRRGVEALEHATGRTFGGAERPLLLSVRSGAAVSMPGMMDTVLDLGINDDVQHALARETGSPAYARDTHLRFLRCYGEIVLKADLDGARAGEAEEVRAGIAASCGRPVPADPWEQLRAAVMAVFDSWYSARARVYRKHYGIPDDSGTAVTVQAMVFGNRGRASGTGVLFTRDPLRGEPVPYGEYLPGGQGEDVVAGGVDPGRLSQLAEELPEVHAELVAAARLLEARCGDMQDIEFTVENGTLYLLQARVGKRAPAAAVRIAVDLVTEGVIDVDEALRRVGAGQVRALLRPRLDAGAVRTAEILAEGQPACPGAATGDAVADPDEAVRRAEAGERVVFMAATTRPEDVHAMIAAEAVCTETGGSTSHAAVVCRGLGRTCVVGCGAGELLRLAGSEVTVDAETGRVLAGRLPMTCLNAEDDPWLSKLLAWAVDRCGIRVLRPAQLDGELVGGPLLDLDEQGVVGIDALPAALARARAVSGRIVETDEGVALAVRAGVRTIVTQEPLPVLLAALAAERETAGRQLAGEAS